MLTADQYAPGSRVRDDDGNDVDVLDTIQGVSGLRYLVITTADSKGLAVLIPEGIVRDEYEARDPDEVQKEREQERADEERADEAAAHPAPAPAPAPAPPSDPAPVAPAPPSDPAPVAAPTPPVTGETGVTGQENPSPSPTTPTQ